MLKLVKRGRIYYLRGTIAGRRIKETTGTADKALAEERLAERQATLYRQHQLGERGHHTFGEAGLIYAQGRDLGHTSRAALADLAKHFGKTPLGKIDQAALDAFIRKRHAASSPAHINRAVITPLTAVMRVAAKRGWCDVPLFERPKIRQHRARYLSRDEADALVAAAAPHLQPLLVFLLHTGARIGEALYLPWEAVDLQRRMVTIYAPKTDTTRGVPLNDTAFLALANLPGRDGAVFRTGAGAPYAERIGGGGQIKTGFRRAWQRAGIGPVTVHELRHTFASWLAMNGYHEATIAELLGHKSRASATITGRYTHLNLEHLRAAVGSLDRAATGPKLAHHAMVER